MPDVADALAGIAFVEHGALDQLDEAGISNLSPTAGEAPLVSRLRAGTMAKIGHDAIIPYVNQAIHRCLEEGANVVLILCTGRLEGINAPIPVFFAEDLAHSGAESLVGEQALGVVIPLTSQMRGAKARWKARMNGPIRVESSNPYVGSTLSIVEAGVRLARYDVQWIILDCMGYTESDRQSVSRATGLPVLLARSLAFRLAAEATLSSSTNERVVSTDR